MTRRRYDRYDAEAEAATPSVVDLDLRVPRGEMVTLAVAIGLLAALVTGVAVAQQDIYWWAVPIRAVLAGLGIGLFSFVLLFGLHTRDERADRKRQRQPQQTRLEVDGTPPTPERQVVPVRLALTDGKHQTRHLDIDITPELQVFARRVLLWRENEKAPLGLSFAEAPAQSVEFDGFLALRDEMMARGLLRWKNPAHHLSGYVFRAGFDEALRYMATYEMEE